MRVKIPRELGGCTGCGRILSTDGELFYCECREPFPVRCRNLRVPQRRRFNALIEYAQEANQ